MINKNFEKWCCSYSGCDGGNINADIWLCGIEWGCAGTHDDGKYYKGSLTNELKQGAVGMETNTYDWKEHNTYHYGRNFAKLYTAMMGGKSKIIKTW